MLLCTDRLVTPLCPLLFLQFPAILAAPFAWFLVALWAFALAVGVRCLRRCPCPCPCPFSSSSDSGGSGSSISSSSSSSSTLELCYLLRSLSLSPRCEDSKTRYCELTCRRRCPCPCPCSFSSSSSGSTGFCFALCAGGRSSHSGCGRCPRCGQSSLGSIYAPLCAGGRSSRGGDSSGSRSSRGFGFICCG
jgi:hypothetical protein